MFKSLLSENIFLRTVAITGTVGLFIVSFLMDRSVFASSGNETNKAARIKIVSSSFEKELAGKKAPAGKIFILLETEWENIHPKQKVDKAKLEGKVDRTMGVGGLAGRKKEKKAEYVDADVAYRIKKLIDHVYLLGDGLAFSLDKTTEEISGGYKLTKPFTISKQGEIQKLALVYLVPENLSNLGFQLFDYSFGHILVPVKGNLEKARGKDEPKEKILGRAGTDKIQLAVLALNLQPDYLGKAAPKGWRYAVVLLSGKSLSGGSVLNIVQFKPKQYTWVETDGGYLYYCSNSSTAVNGYVRFTPEVYQFQELAFLVPERAVNFRLGVRAQNQVLSLDLSKKPLKGMPEAIAFHRDGDVMEVLVFGFRKEQGKHIVDLGLRSLSKRSGLDIQTNQQFFLKVGDKEFKVDSPATASLLFHPPDPFILPPGVALRFELAFNTGDVPTSLRFRGFRSEGALKF